MSGVNGDAHPLERNEDAKSARGAEPDADHESEQSFHALFLDSVLPAPWMPTLDQLRRFNSSRRGFLSLEISTIL